MSKPTYENIDRWLFELTEGNLSADQEIQLFDFLDAHPELASELDAWKNAKVKAPQHQEFNAEALVKPTPFMSNPYLWSTLGVLALLLIGAASTFFIKEEVLYTKSNIDAQIIYSEEEPIDDFIAQLTKSTKATTIEERTNKNLVQVDFASNDNKLNKEEVNLSQSSAHGSTIKSSNAPIIKSSFKKSDLKQTVGNKHFLLSSNESDQQIKSSSVHTEDLDKINDYLAHSGLNTQRARKENESSFLANSATSKETNKTKNSQDLKDSKSKHNASSSKKNSSSFQKSMKKTLRKIQRMANYPVALQNTKTPYFHVPMATSYRANFGMAGSAPGNRIQATSRMQWPSQENGQIMNSISYDSYVYALRGGIGVDVNYNNYQKNDLSNFSAGFTYSPKLSINKKVSFEPAVRVKMGVINLEEGAKSIGHKIELERNNIVSLFEQNKKANGKQLWYRDIGLGFMINTDWFYIGFNADNLGRHNNNFHSVDQTKEYRSDVLYTAITGTEYLSKTRDFKLSTYALYQNYGSLNELWLGANLQYKWIEFGLGASTNFDAAASIGSKFNRFSLRYNVDLTESRLLNDKFLSHQVSMKYLIRPNRNATKFIKL